MKASSERSIRIGWRSASASAASSSRLADEVELAADAQQRAVAVGIVGDDDVEPGRPEGSRIGFVAHGAASCQHARRMRAFVNPAYQTGAVVAPSDAALEFHRGLAGYAPTPLRELGDGVWLKDESDRLGLPAFKVLGASWALERALRADPGIHTLVAASAGNHGRAVAHVAALRGLRARLFLPARAAVARREAIAGEGADVVMVDGTYEDAVERAAAEGAQPGCFELADVGASGPASWVIDGYATLFSELPASFDVALVPVGVGSLGAAAARWGAAVGVPVIAVEPDVAACLTASLAAGRPTLVPTPGTAMAGLDCAEVSEAAWPALRPGIRGTITVSDAETRAAMRALAALGLRIGDSGAAPLAALEHLRTDPECGALREVVRLDRVLLLATEGATDPGGLRGRGRVSAVPADIPVRRNTLLLAGAMAVYSSVLQLVAAVSSLTFVLVTGVEGLLGLGPAIFLAASAISAVPAGRLMDRIGRKPVVAGGYVLRRVRVLADRTGDELDSTVLVIAGFALTGFANGTALQIRTAAGDMYPPERRRAGDLVRAVRVGVRRDPRAGGVRAVVLRSRGRRRDVDGAVAGRRRDQPDRARAGHARPAGSEGHRRADRGRVGRRRRRAAGARRATARDPAPPRRAARDARRAGQLRRDGLSDEPLRLRGRGAPPSRAVERLPGNRRARARDVRAGAVRRRADRQDRPRAGARGRAAGDGGLDDRADVLRQRLRHRGAAVRAGRGVEPVASWLRRRSSSTSPARPSAAS